MHTQTKSRVVRGGAAAALLAVGAIAVVARGDARTTGATSADDEAQAAARLAASAAKRARTDRPGLYRQFGEPVKVGNGRARAYVVYAQQDGGAPIEVGVALTEEVMQGLPAPNPHLGHKASVVAGGHEHVDNHVYLLSLPVRGAAPFQFVEFDWNPGGHEPPGVYDVPHFDFHFWTASKADRESVDPTKDTEYQKKADALPPEAHRPPQYVVAAPPGAPAPGVPLMGVHWVDTRTPELQKVFGKPEAYKPFTTTFLYGSWNGRFTFLEPMITRAYIMSKKAATDPAVRDEVIPIPAPAQVGQAGYYPDAYRITWDAAAKEYRIANTNLKWRE